MSVIKQVIDPERYCVIPRTLIFIFDSQDQVLLIKGASSKKIWPDQYNGIGGHVEFGEDILEAAKRELREETGMEKVPLHFCGQIMIQVTEAMGIAMFVFRGIFNNETLIPSDEGSLEWISLNNLENVPLVEDLPVLIPKIAAYKQSEPIIIGKYIYDQSGKVQLLFN